ncbi:MAG: circularly permuted type 2 ATP-grasp protein [Oceanospirillaceae bacterium]|nr:circularly permuted type 2 ATP-grasp protein [Oceanospirillaceae bacterium]
MSFTENRILGDQSEPMVYARQPGTTDEVYDPEGRMRSHWQYLLDSLQQLGGETLQERQLKAERILRDDGATYTLASDTLNSRTWGLDPVPLLLDSEEWSQIETGLSERAELLNLLLADIYGPRELIRCGILPPELIFSHQGFLRPCQGVKLPGEHQLILHSSDMVRDADGSMVVIGDRTQTPSGAGYALENRTVMRRVFPSLFRDSHVHRLALFFHTLRQTLNRLAPPGNLSGGDLPTVVIMTPGAYSETYFEHTYLANYLGYPLVQGGDLTVRNGYVWMKSLDGLTRVDVILRRVDDNFCDAVELRSDSHLGVPGLLEVARAGRVAVANPLGSGVLENPALLKYLPQISQYFLGHELQLRSVPSYWCGDPDDLAYVLANVEKLVIKRCSRRSGEYGVFGNQLTSGEKQALIARIKQSPHLFAAQDFLSPSLTPSWQNGGLESRPSLLRSFTVAGQGGTYAVMPGGLTRIGVEVDSRLIANQLGSISKDTWVLASEPEKRMTLQPTPGVERREQMRQYTNLPSRMVENLFWMGRYGERADTAIRLMRTVFLQLNSAYRLPEGADRLLLRAVSEVTLTLPGFTAEDPELLKHPEAELLSVICDSRRTGSVKSSLIAMLNCAEEVKELLSADIQRIINDIRDELNGLEGSVSRGMTSAPEESLDPLITALLALSGLYLDSMFRGLGWRFLQIGRRLEKAQQVATLLRALLVPVHGDASDDLAMESALLTAEALNTYRRRYRAETNIASGLGVLLVDRSNPRSLIYQLDKLRTDLALLPARGKGPEMPREQRLVLEVYSAVQLVEMRILASSDAGESTRAALDDLLQLVQKRLNAVAIAISEDFFDHTGGPQQLVNTGWKSEL